MRSALAEASVFFAVATIMTGVVACLILQMG